MRTTSITLAIAALLLGSNAIAGNNNGPDYGDTTNNSYNQGGTANAGAVAGAAAGAISGSYSGGGDASIGDIRNTNTNANTAFGGAGGDGGTGIGVGLGGKGGDANQEQKQTQQQTANGGQAYAAGGTAFGGNGSGNDTKVNTAVTVEGDNYQMKRNAPGIVGGTIYPTASCKGGFGIGGSGPAGGGLLNFATTDKECQTIVLAQNFQSQGRDQTACKLLLTTKTWKRALKADPTLAESCN